MNSQLTSSRRFLTLSNLTVIVIVAVISSATTATAARLLTGANIKNGSLTGADVKTGSLTGKQIKNSSIPESDLAAAVRTKLNSAGQTGPAGPAGPAGTAGAAGSNGARGVSAWDTIPSGQTVTGTFALRLPDIATGTPNGTIDVELPAIAPTALTSNTVNTVAGEGDADADVQCTGTTAAPSAPAGKVCIYPGFRFGATSIQGVVHPYLPSRSFRVGFVFTTAAALWLDGTWAYTAP